MSASQLRLLTLFMERPGELIKREEVAARLWSDTRNIDVATGINTAINRLRRHLQEAPGAPSCIETVIGLGYRLVADLEEIELEQLPVAVTSPEAEVPDTKAPEPAKWEYLEPIEPKVGPELHPVPQERRLYVEQLATPRSTRRVRLIALCSLVLLSALVLYGVRRRASRHSEQASETSTYSSDLVAVTPEEEVGTLTAAAVAPSGKSVAYADRFGVSVHWFANGAERLLGARTAFTVDRLTWLPDESSLLMSGTDDILHHQQVWLVPLQGAYLRLIAEDANRATQSPNGRTIAFTRAKDRELWLAAADGQHPRLLRSAGTGESFGLVLWSPASNRLIVTLRKTRPEAGSGGTIPAGLVDVPGQGAYECIDPKSGQLLDREDGFSTDSGYVLPDGRFYFPKNKTPGPVTGMADLMMVPTDPASGRFLSAPQRVHSFDARHAGSLTASSSGARFAAVLDRAEADVFVANLRQPGTELADVVRITRGVRVSFPHSWAADSRSILLENDSLTPAGSPAKWSIFHQPLDGSKPALIADMPGDAAMAQLSPDGRWILFLEFTAYPQHAIGIFRVPAAGGYIEQVPTHGEIEEFHCSASSTGRCVVRKAVGNEALVYYALDPVQGIGQELGRTRWQPNRLGDWGLSADGSTVASASQDTLHPSIRLIKLGTPGTQPAQVREIAVPGHGTTLGASWAPDGQSLFVECRTESGFELVSLDLAGHIKLLRQSPILIWAVPSRDGKKIAFPGLTLSSSVWASNGAP